jgi:uncharacterized protein YciI
MATKHLQIHHVIVHSPGPKWLDGVDFREQPTVDEHVAYYSRLSEEGNLFEGGPFLDSSGGMMVLSPGVTKETAEQLAQADPTVIGGLLVARVHPWLRAFTS